MWLEYTGEQSGQTNNFRFGAEGDGVEDRREASVSSLGAGCLEEHERPAVAASIDRLAQGQDWPRLAEEHKL